MVCGGALGCFVDEPCNKCERREGDKTCDEPLNMNFQVRQDLPVHQELYYMHQILPVMRHNAWRAPAAGCSSNKMPSAEPAEQQPAGPSSTYLSFGPLLNVVVMPDGGHWAKMRVKRSFLRYGQTLAPTAAAALSQLQYTAFTPPSPLSCLQDTPATLL